MSNNLGLTIIQIIIIIILFIVIIYMLRQNIALKNPASPKTPKLTGYPINAVFAIITVTKTLQSLLSSKPNFLRIINDIIPTINEEQIIAIGRTPNL